MTFSNHRQIGRPREFDMEQVLDAAVLLFRERGYNGTSIADLRAAMGLTAGSLYKAFKDKRAIFVAALDRYLAIREMALEHRLNEARTGRDKILAMLRSYADVSHGLEGRRGCMVLSGLTEVDTFDEALAHRLFQALAGNEQRLTRFIKQGILDGSLPSRLDARVSARYLLCVVEGLRVLGKRGAGADEINMIVEQAMRALE
ncbi:TetR/AcrR family transcriptional regulator [Allopusillimonas soli]|uniref:TetR/AcrR family transcriptional regulator n=2 Tax=Allopusillimonas soli TaxID=659016 RepID=A0A853FG69_9BURK|nr:TetR/AcrR family transcriptional regulator [Allopusillimonas soli]TEA71815.1 TetR/AcrR family transcriptional regulator [Allopusillimonas soli]